jgi:hypothetical protein
MTVDVEKSVIAAPAAPSDRSDEERFRKGDRLQHTRSKKVGRADSNELDVSGRREVLVEWDGGMRSYIIVRWLRRYED